MGEIRVRRLEPVRDPAAMARALQILRRGAERVLLERSRQGAGSEGAGLEE
jgi:hypothetical protein